MRAGGVPRHADVSGKEAKATVAASRMFVTWSSMDYGADSYAERWAAPLPPR